MKSLTELIKDARESASWRGHSLGPFIGKKTEGRYSAWCSRCGKGVQIVENPGANEIDVSGEAVSLNCLGYKLFK